MVSVRKQCGYYEENRHPRKEEDTGPVIVVLIPEEEPQHRKGDIGKPKEIWDHEPFAERDMIIQSHMDHGIMACDVLFQP